MPDASSFQDLIRRLRAGDADAVTELVRSHESIIRRAVRFRLVDARLGAVVNSEDICQSVFMNFYMRMAAGQYDLEKPEQLVGLLKTMARNKLASQARRQRAECRDNRRNAPGLDEGAFVAHDPSPSQAVAVQEIVQEVGRRLTPEEQQLVDLRNQGMSWDEIAAQLGTTPVVLRKRLSRALDRVAQELGLEDGNDE